MEIDWDQYRTRCADQRAGVLERFESTLLNGAALATVQSAPVYTGQLTAALVTVLRQMTDAMSQMMCDQTDRLRQAMRERYFTRLGGIEELEIAREYVRTHFQYLEPSREDTTGWLLSFQGRRSAAGKLVREIDKETDLFIRQEVPGIVKEYTGGQNHRIG